MNIYKLQNINTNSLNGLVLILKHVCKCSVQQLILLLSINYK